MERLEYKRMFDRFEFKISRQPIPSLPAMNCLTRTANRARQQGRPENPKDLNFEIDMTHIPENFLREDIRVGEFRHVMFFTDRQRSILDDVKTWFMDATFKVVDAPFTQMFSIHAFIRSGDSMKQVPLVFVMMSKRRRIDYEQVFIKLKERLVRHSLSSAVMDFEAATWQAFRAVFPGASVKGCGFHWSQAVFKKIKSCGLEEAYQKQDATRRLLRKLLFLPYLPHNEIRPAFDDLQTYATTEPLETLFSYVENTWMNSSVWSVRNWSVFGRAIRTNNDVEGWHRKLNEKATRPNVQFYLLVPLLHDEAALVPLKYRLVSDGKLQRNQRKKVRQQQARILTAWDLYRQGSISGGNLLRELSQMGDL